MQVSIVINNYNYARYVGVAIGSALAQTWAPLEVIVVDDGSSDDSWSVIQRSGDRVHAIRQDNGGQGAAYNAGFAASGGDWVLFLDSDDMLDRDAVARLMALAGPRAAKVHGRLRRVDADGQPIGGAVPYIAHDGDVSPIVRRFCQYGSPPSSGNLFRRSAIAPYFPLHAPSWRRSADTVPILLSTFHGEVATVPGTIGCYRLHMAASRHGGLLGNKDLAFGPALAQTQRRRDLVAAWGTRCTGIEWPQAPLMLPWDWRLRALSWRLARSEHPYPDDTRRTIWRGLNDALAHWPGYTALERQVQRAWVAFVLGAPLTLVAALAPSNTSGWLRRTLKGVRKVYPS